MAEKREPYIEGHRVDSSVSTTVSDSKVKVYVGIEADTGTYDLTYQQTPKLFVQEYSTKSKPDTNDASTLLHAGKLVENFGIYVKRVNKDSILPGIVSTGKYGEVGYFDTNFNPINNYSLFKFIPKIDDVSQQKLAMVIDNVLYINNNIETTDELKEAFSGEGNPYYLNESGSSVPMKSDLDAFIELKGETKLSAIAKSGEPVLVYKLVDDIPVELFYVINVGVVNKVEDFLAEVASWAKNYRSNADTVEFIEYEPTSLLMCMDVSASNNPKELKAIQACDTLNNNSRLVKNFTKLEFIDRVEDPDSHEVRYLLTNTEYDVKGKVKYLDVGGFRYVPKILDDNNNYADSTVTLKRCTFGGTDFGSNCTISDAILSSIDSMVADSDTTKPELAYCSTEQVFKVEYSETDEGMTLVPSVAVKKGNKYYNVKTGFYGNAFEKSLVSFEVLNTNEQWVEFKGVTQVSDLLIDNTGYAHIRLKFDGKVNAIEDGDVAGIAIAYATYSQSQSELEPTYKVAFIGKNVTENDVEYFEEVESPVDFAESIKVSKINVNTTDLGVICNLVNVSIENRYGFTKLTSAETITYGSGGSAKTVTVDSSIVNKLYIYFLKSRNVTFGITGYDPECWRKYTDVYQKNYIFDNQDTVSAGVPGYYAVLVKDTIYYNGIKNETAEIPAAWDAQNEVPVATIALKPNEFIDALDNALRNQFSTIAKLSDGDFIVGEVIDSPLTSGKVDVVDFNTVDQTLFLNTARYAIIQRFTSAAKSFGIELTFDKTDKEILKFVNSYNGTEYTDKISFNVGKIDGYGTNISYKSYNLYDGRAFFIKELNPEVPVIEMEVPSFGNDITPKKATVQDYINALDDLVSDEFKPSFLWDAGLCNNSYTDALTSLADKTYSMVPISVPKYEYASQIKSWKSAFNVDNPVQYVLDGWYYNTVFGDISFECCPTYYYLVVKLSNANSISKEFQTAFYKTRGIVSAGTPVRNVALKKSEREELLDLRINSIVRNKANSISYINQNFTNQQVESDFSEEQNVCISNEVCRTADDYADHNIIAKNNTENLRATVTSELTRLIRERIMDSRGDDTAQSFYVECNKVNNPEPIIKARKLVIDVWVTYNKSVNAVLVYSRTKSLDQG